MREVPLTALTERMSDEEVVQHLPSCELPPSTCLVAIGIAIGSCFAFVLRYRRPELPEPCCDQVLDYEQFADRKECVEQAEQDV